MSKTRLLLASLALVALGPAESLAQSGEVVTDAVSYSRSFAQGVERFDAGRYDEALEALLSAVVANPRDPDALFDVGVTYEKLGRPLEASAAFKSAVELRPGSAKARARLCSSLAATGQYYRAIAYYKKALDIDPGNGAVRRGLDRLTGYMKGELTVVENPPAASEVKAIPPQSAGKAEVGKRADGRERRGH
jgi:tetratricopeptide (TPR) repeat protein